MFCFDYTPSTFSFGSTFTPFSVPSKPNFAFPMPIFWGMMNYMPFQNPVSVWSNNFNFNSFRTNNSNTNTPTVSLINPRRVSSNTTNNNVSLFPQLSLTNTRQTSVTTNNNSNHGQKMLDYAYQFAGKTQNEMRQIMKGQNNYAFHTNLWCADFVSFITGKSLGEENLPEWYKKCNRAYVPDIEKQARKNGAIVAERHNGTIDTSNVKPGNFVIINWERDNSRVDHIGYVIKIEGNKVYTIEGNAGGKVSYNTRDLSLVHSFVDIG